MKKKKDKSITSLKNFSPIESSFKRLCFQRLKNLNLILQYSSTQSWTITKKLKKKITLRQSRSCFVSKEKKTQMKIIKELFMRLMVIRTCLKQRYQDRMRKTFSTLQTNLNDKILTAKQALIRRLEDKLESRLYESTTNHSESNQFEIKKQRV